MNKKLIAPIVTAAAMLATSIGSTFALFSSKASSRIDIEAGRVQVDLANTIDWAVSHYEKGDDAFDAVAAAEDTEFDALFENGNTADISSSEVESAIELDRFTPLDQIAVNMKATNSSDINIKWRYYLELSGDVIPALDIKVGGQDYSTTETYKKVFGHWSGVVKPSETELMDLDVVVTFPDHGEDDNQYQEKTGLIKFGIEAVQGNAEVRDEVCAARSAEDLKNYSKLWNLGEEDRPLVLTADIDMAGIDWECLGNYKYPYSGEINGNGYTIKNLSVTEGIFSEEGEYIAGFVGIAGSANEHSELVISNLNFENASINLPENGSNCGVVIGFAPSTGNFDSYGAGVGADNYQCDNIIVKNCNISGEVIDMKSAGGVMGKAYTTGRIEIVDNNVDVDVTVGKNHIAEIVGYANGLESMLITGNTIAGQLNIPAGDQLADDEVVVGTFLESYLVHSNTSTTKLLLDGTEIDDPVQITCLFEEDGSLAKMDVVWDGSDLQKNAIVAIHGSDKFTLTLKNSGSSNGAAIMSALATDNTKVVLENFQTTGNVSVPNLVLKGNCKISNSYTTAKKTLTIEDGIYKNVTIDANGVATMNGGKVTTLNVAASSSLTLNGGAETNIVLNAGSSLVTAANIVEASADNYTFKVTINAVGSKTTLVNGVAVGSKTQATYMYFLEQ